MYFIRNTILFSLVLLLTASLSAQVKSIGSPIIRNYTRSDYQAGSQTWAVEQGENGMMYFANNNGLLEFDGYYWKVYPLANKSVVRSIKHGNNGLLYAGGFNEIGYYELGDMGGAVYNTLTNLIPEDKRDFGDVWKIYIHPDGVIFQTYYQLMFYKEGHFRIIEAPSLFHFSFMVNNEYYINDREQGLMRYAMDIIYPLVGVEDLKGAEIWGIQTMNKKLLIATASEGVFTYNGNSLAEWVTECSDFLKQNQIYCSLRLSENILAFGTIQNGLIICNNQGIVIQQISMEEGLQNNTILCVRKDDLGNLWLGTDRGIDYVEINSPLSQLSHTYGISTGYTAIVYDANIYLGTNQGLFTQHFISMQRGCIGGKKLKMIENTQGQVWTLQSIDGLLFCGHNNGTFLVDGEIAEKISDIAGGWTYLQVPDNPTKIIGGTYSGLILFEKENGKWKYKRRINGFIESTRTMAFDPDGSLWVAHGYKGVFHLRFNDTFDSINDLEFYNSQNSILSDQGVNLSQMDMGIVFTSPDGVFAYNNELKTFQPNSKLNTLLINYDVISIKNDVEGNYWYFANDGAGVLRIREDGNYSNISIPFRQLKGRFVKGFEFVFPLNDQNIIFGTENGFVHYNPTFNKNYSYPYQTYLRSMRVMKPDSVYYFDTGMPLQPISLKYRDNNAEFIFSANDFENPAQVTYSTLLEGYDLKWTEWQSRSSREFTNLHEGKYAFKIKAKNLYGTESEIQHVNFEVTPPWQRTLIAYISYALIFLLSMGLFAYLLKKRFERSRLESQKRQQELFRKKEEELEHEAIEAEKQIIHMRNEKLQEEMIMKNKELANATIQMLQKNKILISLKKELKNFADHIDNEQKYKVKRLLRRIDKEIDDENQWKIFETHFESVHEEFLLRIKSAYNDLTPRELKLCAYLRMNISSKEIAALMNISTRGVEISRYRLRKKLNLKREINLTDFILSF